MGEYSSGYRKRKIRYNGSCERCGHEKTERHVMWMPDFHYNPNSPGHLAVREEMRNGEYGWVCVDCFVSIQMNGGTG